MLDEDSPFRRLPTNLDARQAMFCDGVRFAIEMLDLSYRRLEAELSKMAVDEVSYGTAPSAFLDAWGFVDSANRLRVLLRAFPSMKKNTPPLQLVIRALEPAEVLRNSVQHLPGDIEVHASSHVPTWGVLHWMTATKANEVKILMLVPGASRSMEGLGPVRSPAGRIFHSDTDHVTLSAFGSEVDLSATHRAVTAFVPSVEDALHRAFDGIEERSGSDLLVVLSGRAEPDD